MKPRRRNNLLLLVVLFSFILFITTLSSTSCFAQEANESSSSSENRTMTLFLTLQQQQQQQDNDNETQNETRTANESISTSLSLSAATTVQASITAGSISQSHEETKTKSFFPDPPLVLSTSVIFSRGLQLASVIFFLAAFSGPPMQSAVSNFLLQTDQFTHCGQPRWSERDLHRDFDPVELENLSPALHPTRFFVGEIKNELVFPSARNEFTFFKGMIFGSGVVFLVILIVTLLVVKIITVHSQKTRTFMQSFDNLHAIRLLGTAHFAVVAPTVFAFVAISLYGEAGSSLEAALLIIFVSIQGIIVGVGVWACWQQRKQGKLTTERSEAEKLDVELKKDQEEEDERNAAVKQKSLKEQVKDKKRQKMEENKKKKKNKKKEKKSQQEEARDEYDELFNDETYAEQYAREGVKKVLSFKKRVFRVLDRLYSYWCISSSGEDWKEDEHYSRFSIFFEHGRSTAGVVVFFTCPMLFEAVLLGVMSGRTSTVGGLNFCQLSSASIAGMFFFSLAYCFWRRIFLYRIDSLCILTINFLSMSTAALNTARLWRTSSQLAKSSSSTSGDNTFTIQDESKATTNSRLDSAISKLSFASALLIFLFSLAYLIFRLFEVYDKIRTRKLRRKRRQRELDLWIATGGSTESVEASLEELLLLQLYEGKKRRNNNNENKNDEENNKEDALFFGSTILEYLRPGFEYSDIFHLTRTNKEKRALNSLVAAEPNLSLDQKRALRIVAYHDPLFLPQLPALFRQYDGSEQMAKLIQRLISTYSCDPAEEELAELKARRAKEEKHNPEYVLAKKQEKRKKAAAANGGGGSGPDDEALEEAAKDVARQELEQRIRFVFQEKDPSQLIYVDELLSRYKNRLEELLKKVQFIYGEFRFDSDDDEDGEAGGEDGFGVLVEGGDADDDEDDDEVEGEWSGKTKTPQSKNQEGQEGQEEMSMTKKEAQEKEEAERKSPKFKKASSRFSPKEMREHDAQKRAEKIRFLAHRTRIEAARRQEEEAVASLQEYEAKQQERKNKLEQEKREKEEQEAKKVSQLREAIIGIISEYDNERVSEIPALLVRFKGREELFLESLVEKYTPSFEEKKKKQQEEEKEEKKKQEEAAVTTSFAVQISEPTAEVRKQSSNAISHHYHQEQFQEQEVRKPRVFAPSPVQRKVRKPQVSSAEFDHLLLNQHQHNNSSSKNRANYNDNNEADTNPNTVTAATSLLSSPQRVKSSSSASPASQEVIPSFLIPAAAASSSSSSRLSTITNLFGQKEQQQGKSGEEEEEMVDFKIPVNFDVFGVDL